MQIKPVPKADKPEYPTASEIDIPKVLNASKPNKWKRNAAIGAVMVGMVGSIWSCTSINSEDKNYARNVLGGIALFDHGDGVGVIGCVVCTPPVFMTEYEAMKVIVNELAEGGIHYTLNQDTSKGINILAKRFKRHYRTNARWDEDTIVTKKIPFEAYLDSTDFALMFVSEEKYNNYGDVNTSGISIESYLIKPLAIKIQKEGNNQDKHLVIFYDPVSKLEMRNPWFWEDDIRTAAFKKSKKELRKQVQDFIKWYKENKGKK